MLALLDAVSPLLDTPRRRAHNVGVDQRAGSRVDLRGPSDRAQRRVEASTVLDHVARVGVVTYALTLWQAVEARFPLARHLDR